MASSATKLEKVMKSKIISREGLRVKFEVEVELKESMLSTEESIQESVNALGSSATEIALEHFDTDGSVIEIGAQRWHTKGKQPKKYQSPYGAVSVNRHVYQSSGGGKTYCPMEKNGRIVGGETTPKFAKSLTHKFANGSSKQVREDLLENHGRKVARSYVQKITDYVGGIAQAKEEEWEYVTPKLNEKVTTVGIGLDGTCMLTCTDGWREAMTGTISLYSPAGNRLHTIYLGATPEYGKDRFYKRLDREIEHIRSLYPSAHFVGIADGARENWKFLKGKVSTNILDFYHASEYVGKAAPAITGDNIPEAQEWTDLRCHELKHDIGAAKQILSSMKAVEGGSLKEKSQENLKASVTYFENNHEKMNYAQYLDKNLPIGSGVTEAACKTLIKQRLCASGMKWKEKGASAVIALRSLVLTNQRWGQFWDKINQFGIPAYT